MASFEAVIGQSLLEHVKLRSSWMITVPSQNPNPSLTTLLSSRSSSSAIAEPIDPFIAIGQEHEHRHFLAFGWPSGHPDR